VSRVIRRSALVCLLALCGCAEPPDDGLPPLRGRRAARPADGESDPASSPAAAPAKVDAERERPPFAPLYATREELRRAAERAAADPGFRARIAVEIDLAAAWSHVPDPPKGAYATYPVPVTADPFDPAGRSPAFRRLLADARAARDLALVWALKVEPPQGRLSTEPVTRDDLGRRAVAILRRYAGTGGLAPTVVGKGEALELGVAVAVLYHAADLVWEHPAWLGEAGDFRSTTFCPWANQWARAMQVQLGGLSGLDLAWAHHLWLASIAVAARSPQIIDNHAARFRRAADADDYFGLSGILARELTPNGQLPREQWRLHGSARATLALAAYMLSLRAAENQAGWALPKDGAWSPAGLPAAKLKLGAAMKYQAEHIFSPPPEPALDDSAGPTARTVPAPVKPPTQLIWFRAAGAIWPEAAAAAKVTADPTLWLLGPLPGK
jgi:hypothetical protein